MKKCKIINSDFSWVMNVDEKEILFQNYESAIYFKEHYKELGYDVEFIDNNFHSEDKY